MPNVLDVTINPDIVLDEKSTKGMPDDIRARILITMTIAMERYDCDWTELTWKVDKNSVISVKPKKGVVFSFPEKCGNCDECHYGKIACISGRPFSDLMCNHPFFNGKSEKVKLEAVENNVKRKP